MSELTSNAVREFWRNYQDPMIYRVVTFMEGVEDWPHDGDPELEAAILRLDKKLAELGSKDLKVQHQLIKLCVNLKAGRGLRLLHVMDTNNPGSASKLLMFAENVCQNEDNPNASLFLRRNIVFERLRLLARVFAPQRFALILKALEDEDD